MTGSTQITIAATNSSSTSEEVKIPSGFTLVGIEIPVEATSTTFNLAHATKAGGTYLTLKDPLGIYTTAGSAIPFTIGSTSLGSFTIPPSLGALLYSYMKVILGSSETAPVTLIFKDIA